MIFISKQDIGNIKQGIVQDAIKKAYKLMLSSEFNMPDRSHVTDGENVLLLMPCFSKRFFSTKLVSVFPKAQQFNKPSVNGVLVLNDNLTGEPLAVMNGAALTAQRTGAVGGLAVDKLTDDSIESGGILGAGVQGYQQARYLLFNRKIKQLNICDLNPAAAQIMGDLISREYDDVTCTVCSKAVQLVEQSEVIIAATTSSEPLFDMESEQIRGKTFISIGSFRPDMQEFPDSIIRTADKVYADTLFACKESGDIAVPLRKKCVEKGKIEPFSDLLENPVSPTGKTLFFKSVGMALFDLAAGMAIYQQAIKDQIGVQLEL